LIPTHTGNHKEDVSNLKKLAKELLKISEVSFVMQWNLGAYIIQQSLQLERYKKQLLEKL